jgi:hypothetical protein
MTWQMGERHKAFGIVRFHNVIAMLVDVLAGKANIV